MPNITSSGPSAVPELKKMVEQLRSMVTDMSEIVINQNPELIEAVKEITD